MNKVILMGRLTRDPEVRSTQSCTLVARYTLAVDRMRKSGEEQTADFINCVVFGKGAEFVEQYLHQGIKIIITGRIQTGSYTNKDGQKVYTTDIIVESHEFAESKASQSSASSGQPQQPQSAPTRPNPTPAPEDGFMNIPDALDEELPFRN